MFISFKRVLNCLVKTERLAINLQNPLIGLGVCSKLYNKYKTMPDFFY